VILAGGAGERIKIITGGKPKTLLKVAGKTIVEHVIDSLLQVKVHKIAIVTDKPSEFEDITIKYGRVAEVTLRRQKEPDVLGAILTAEDLLSEGALLIYGDTLAPPEAILTVIRGSESTGEPTILVIPEEDVSLYGAVKVTEGKIKEFIEKPHYPIEEAYAFGGIAVFNERLMNFIRDEANIEKGFMKYIRFGNLYAALWSGWWVDIGYPWNMLEAVYYLLSDYDKTIISEHAKIESTAIIEGPVIIEDGVYVDHYSVIKGPAYIGKDVTIGSHSYVRPYTNIEDGTTISSYAEVVWSCIGERVTVGRSSFLGFSVIGNDAVVEPSVITKLLVSPEEGIKAIKVVKKKKEYSKLGAFIGAGARVPANKILEAGTSYPS
jgi:glucose-1-phosphate thymidylyltransferase